MKINLDLNAWSIGTTIVAVAFAIAYMQADVRDLKAADGRLLERMRSERVEITERVRRIEERTERDRDTIANMQGDIRVIRQILEGARQAPIPQFTPQFSPR